MADAFSAMSGNRVYRPVLPLDRAWAELRAHSGSQFDPEILEAFGRVVDEEGQLLQLGPELERTLGSEVHVRSARA